VEETIMKTAVLILAVAPLGCAGAWKSAGIGLVLSATGDSPHSVFPKTPGAIDEDAIAEMMEPPRLPAGNFRVAVAAVPTFGPGAPDSLASGIEPAHEFARALETAGRVELATEVTPFLPTRGGGIEGLREMAARYRAPYLLVYVERFEDDGGVNAFGLGYVTIVGGLFLPSYTVQINGVAEASLLDVRTGTLLFTVREPVKADSMALPLSVPSRIHQLVERESAEAAKRLAKRVADQWMRFAALAPVGFPKS
jgi:hypothetical protein